MSLALTTGRWLIGDLARRSLLSRHAFVDGIERSIERDIATIYRDRSLAPSGAANSRRNNKRQPCGGEKLPILGRIYLSLIRATNDTRDRGIH